MNSWNGLDFFVFLILALNTIRGMSRGAGLEIIALMCLSAALIFSIKFTVPLTNFLNTSPLLTSVVDNWMVKNFMHAMGAGPLTLSLLHELMYTISLLICFVSVFSITEACIAFSGYTQSLSLSGAVVNRKIGAAIGFTRGYIITLIFLSILTEHIYKGGQSSGSYFIRESFFVKLLENQTKKLDDVINSQNPENYQELYKDKPINEQQVIQQLLPDEVQKQQQ